MFIENKGILGMIILVQRSFSFITSFMVKFLEEHLQVIGGERWWENFVLNNLSVSQRGMVLTRRLTKLGALDTAAILRVFDKNWYELKDQASLPWELKTLILEILDVRNNRSHGGVVDDDFNYADLYRFIDTVHRSLTMLRAQDFILKEVLSDKMTAFAELSKQIFPPPPIASTVAALVAEIDDHKIPAIKDKIDSNIMVVELESKEEKALSTIKDFTIMEPMTQMAVEVKTFIGKSAPATMIPWKVVANNLKLTIVLVMIDDIKSEASSDVLSVGEEDASSEFQVYCDSRIRLKEEKFFVMDLRTAIKNTSDNRPTRKNLNLVELSKLVGLDVRTTLMSFGSGGVQVGTRSELYGETNRNRGNLAVKFPIENQAVPIVAFLITTVLPLLD
jgi:hypothetical protein